MPDDADRAFEYEERMREVALRVRKPEPKPCGHCHNCGEHIKFGSFCNGYCAETWHKGQRQAFKQKDVIDG